MTTIDDLILVLNEENKDSEVLAFSVVVKDNLSGEITQYFPGLCDEIFQKKI